MVYIYIYIINILNNSAQAERIECVRARGNRGSHRVTHERNFLLQFQFHFDKRNEKYKMKATTERR